MADSKQPTVLVLDDEPEVASFLATVLRSLGYQVSVATSLQQARNALRESPPDALLADIRVGEFNGLQVAILFRTLSPEGRIVMISGHDDPVIRREAESLNATFLVKPVDVATLREAFG